jgi:hypothetical protein
MIARNITSLNFVATCLFTQNVRPRCPSRTVQVHIHNHKNLGELGEVEVLEALPHGGREGC